MFRDISFVTLSFIYVNILGYVFHSIVSRSLGPVGYGEFIVLYSFMLTVGNITVLLGTVSIKTIIENFDKKYEFLRSLRFLSLIAGLFFAVCAFALSHYLKNFLHVTQNYYFFIIAFAWLGMFMLAVERSFLQSTGKFPLFAFSFALELTLRFIAALVTLYVGLKIGGVLSASAIGVFIVLFLLLLINGEPLGKTAKLSIKKIFKIALYVSPSGFFIYADAFFIRRIFDEYLAGLLASVSIVGKVLVWFTITILGVYFPKFVETKNSSALRKFIFQMFGIVILIEIFAQIVFFIAGKPIFLILFGRKFEPALLYLPSYFLTILPLLLSIVFINIATAVERGIYLIYLHLIFYYTGFFCISFNSIYEYFKYIFLLNLFFFAVYILFLKIKNYLV